MIQNTGERILLDYESPQMIARHMCAYKFAKEFCTQDTRVLDIGCGEGYGTHYLAGAAKSASGIDYSLEAIEYASGKYQRQNLEFINGDVFSLALADRKFDIICCFQVIEHIRETDQFLGKIALLLERGGEFICSTCHKFDASPGSDIPCNKFHVKEYDASEFPGLLGKYFTSIELSGLKRGMKFNLYRRLKKSGLCNFLPDSCNPVKKFYQDLDCGNFNWVKNDLDSALDLIAVCRR